MDNGDNNNHINSSKRDDEGQQKGEDEKGVSVAAQAATLPTEDDNDNSSSTDEEENGDWDKQFAFAKTDRQQEQTAVEAEEDENEDVDEENLQGKGEECFDQKVEDSGSVSGAPDWDLPRQSNLPELPKWEKKIQSVSGPEHREEQIVAVAETKFNKNVPMDPADTWDFSLQALDKNYKSKVLWIEGNFYQSLVGKCLHEMHHVPCACEDKKKLAVCRLCHVVFCSNQCFKRSIKRETGQDEGDNELQELKEDKPGFTLEPDRKTEFKNATYKARPQMKSIPMVETTESKYHHMKQREVGQNKNFNNFNRISGKGFHKQDQQQRNQYHQDNQNKFFGSKEGTSLQKTHPVVPPASFWPTQVQVSNAGPKVSYDPTPTKFLQNGTGGDGLLPTPTKSQQEAFGIGRGRKGIYNSRPTHTDNLNTVENTATATQAVPVTRRNSEEEYKQVPGKDLPVKILRYPGGGGPAINEEESKRFFSSKRGQKKGSPPNSHTGEGEPRLPSHNFSEQGSRCQDFNTSTTSEPNLPNTHRHLNNESQFQNLNHRSSQNEHFKIPPRNNSRIGDNNFNSSSMPSNNINYPNDHNPDCITGDDRTGSVHGGSNHERYNNRNSRGSATFPKNMGAGRGKFGKSPHENPRDFVHNHGNQNYRSQGQPPFSQNEGNFRRQNGRFGSEGSHEMGISTGGLNDRSENDFSAPSFNGSYMTDRNRQDGSNKGFNRGPSVPSQASSSTYYSAQSTLSNKDVLNLKFDIPSGVPLPVHYMRGRHFNDFGVITSRNLRLFKTVHPKIQAVQKRKMEMCEYGKNCLVKYISSDFGDSAEEWYRAMITKNLVTNVGVYFIDLGITAVVNREAVCELPQEFFKPDPLALRIRCLNVNVDNNDPEVADTFDTLVTENMVKIRITHKDNVELFRFGCQLEVQHVNKWFDAGVLFEKHLFLTKDNQAKSIILEEQQNAITPISKIVPPEEHLPISGEFETVKLTHVISPNEFYVTDSKLNKMRIQLEEKLKDPNMKLRPVETLEHLGYPLLVVADKIGALARVKVLEVADESAFVTVVVQKVDQGEILTVQFENLMKLPRDLQKPTSCVYKCSLPLKPSKLKSNKALFEEITKTLQQLKDAETTLRTNVFLLERSTHFVDLFLDTSNKGCTSSFIKKGWGELSHNVNLDQSSPDVGPHPRPL